jgi:CTP synthase (UTP-ammonia lyase)
MFPALLKQIMLLQEEIYLSVIEKEKREESFRKTVQVVPHITNEIKDKSGALK